MFVNRALSRDRLIIHRVLSVTVGRRPLSEVVSSGEPSGEPAPGAGHTMHYRQPGRAQWLVLPVVLLRGVKRAYPASWSRGFVCRGKVVVSL